MDFATHVKQITSEVERKSAFFSPPGYNESSNRWIRYNQWLHKYHLEGQLDYEAYSFLYIDPETGLR